MESVLLTVIILVILGTCYTSGLTLNDLYPYGTEHGDTMRTGENDLPAAPLLAPIDNLVAPGPDGLSTATEYQVTHRGYLTIGNNNENLNLDLLIQVFEENQPSIYSDTKIYTRTTADARLINRAMDQINEGFPNTFCSTSPPTQLIIATWIDYLRTDSNPGSNFQAIFVTNGNITFGIVLYVSVSVSTAASTGLLSDPSLFPFGTTVINAPTMMLNSNIPGTYIFSMNHIPPDTCSTGCFSCKARLFQLACEAKRINGENVPASCNN